MFVCRLAAVGLKESFIEPSCVYQAVTQRCSEKCCSGKFDGWAGDTALLVGCSTNLLEIVAN